MVIPFILEEHEVCPIIQAQATTFQLSRKYLKLKVLFCQWKSGLLMYLCLYLNLISFMYECQVTVTLEKTNPPTVRRFVSLQKLKIPIWVCWPECVDVPDQICQQWETLQELLKRLKASPIARTAFLSCHSKGFFPFSPSSWICKQSKRRRWMATTKTRSF